MNQAIGGLVSGDSHVNEPRDLWRDNLPARFRDQAMRGLEAGDDGNWQVVLEGHHIDRTGAEEAERMLAADPGHRYRVMEEEGIAGECIFPTIGLYVWMLTDPDGGAASCRVYNDWIADSLGRSPRFRCAGLVPSWRPEDAVAEVERIAESGLGAVMVPAVATPDWNHRTWSPLWSAIAASGLPAVVHQGTGHSMYFYRGPGAGVANLLATQSMAPRMAGLLATSGVLEANPDLHVVFVEYNVGWLAWAMQTLDYYQRAFSEAGYTPEGKKWVNVELAEPPSFYMRRQVHSTFQDDPIGLNNIEYTGAEALIWGSDYPHHEGTYPHSQETVARLADGVKDADAVKVFRDNAASLFHFDRAVLDEPLPVS
jgi:predicted TIM-barrel fold metal-dependent hydrolase